MINYIDWTLDALDVGEDEQVDCCIGVHFTWYKCAPDEYPGHDYADITWYELISSEYMEEAGRIMEQADLDKLAHELDADYNFQDKISPCDDVSH